MRLNIQKKIILLSAAIFLFACWADNWVNGLYFSSEYSKVLKDEVFIISNTLKNQLDRLLRMHIPICQLEGFEELCQAVITEHTFLSYVMVVDTEGQILFHNNPSRHGEKISDPLVLKGIAGLNRSVQNSVVNKEKHYDFFIPVFENGTDHVATIRTGFPATFISDKTRQMTQYSFGIAALFFLIGLLVFFSLLNFWVGRPIKNFIAAIETIRQNWTDGRQLVRISSHDEIGQLAGAFNQMTDELRQTTVSKEYMDNIIGNMLNSLIVLGTDQRIESTNQATTNLLGYREEELAGEELSRVLMPDDDARSHPLQAVEMVYTSKTGKKIPVLFSSSLLKDKAGNIQGTICIAQDITQLKRAEEEKTNAQKIANENKKLALIGQVAGKMAHDFNNILASIMGNSELALIDCKDKKTAKVFDLILKQTLRGRNLTRNLVAFAKSSSPKYEYFNINEKVGLVVDLMKKELADIPVAVETTEDLPVLLADPGMIEHTLMNLLQNSIHAVGKTDNPLITLRTFRADGDLCFEVEDNGCGLPEQYHDSIYDPSFTLKGSKDSAGVYQANIKGSGYGMSNVKKYVSQHNGTINFSSDAGTGTTVTVRLPVIKEELSTDEKKIVQAKTGFSDKHILILEDETAISKVQNKILSQEPCRHKVDIADTGSVAMALFDKNQYDVISLDYVVPGKYNGLDIYQYIRKKDRTVPVLFASGNLEFLESIAKLKQEDPHIDHLTKPFTNMDYINALHSLLFRKETLHQGEALK